MDEKNNANNMGVEPAEVPSEAPSGTVSQPKVDEPVPMDMESAAPSVKKSVREKKAKRSKGAKAVRGVFVTLLVVAVLALGGAAYLSEFWVPAEADAYTAPEVQVVEPEVVMNVGETYTIETECGENEEVTSVVAADEDILAVEGSNVTALGVYFGTTVTVTTMEKEVPVIPPRYENIVVFEKDIAPMLCNIRSYLRDLIGVEPIAEPRTELRELAIYEHKFVVGELGDGTNTDTEFGKLYVGNDADMEFELAEGEVILNVVSSDESVATVEGKTNDEGVTTYTVAGEGVGDTTLVATVGFMKTVDAETFAEYEKTLPADESEPEGEEATDGEKAEEPDAAKELQVPVATRSITQTVSVAKKPVYSYGGGGSSYGGGTNNGGSNGGGGGNSTGGSTGGGSTGGQATTGLTAAQIASIVSAGNAALGSRYWAEANYYDASCNVGTSNLTYEEAYNRVMALVAITYPAGRVFNIGSTIIVAYS